jgi:hypothetical protein
MSEMNSLSNEHPIWSRRGLAKVVGHVLALMSLIICLMFWLGMFYTAAAEEPFLNFSGFAWLKIMGFAVALAVIATALRSKLWYGALPV